MTAVLSRLRATGYEIWPEAGGIVCRWQGEGAPDPATVRPLLAELRRRKAEVLENFEERAAIIEYDGGLSRTEAERLAWGCIGRKDAGASQNVRKPNRTNT